MKHRLARKIQKKSVLIRSIRVIRVLFLISSDITPCLTKKFYMHPMRLRVNRQTNAKMHEVTIFSGVK